VLGAVAVVLFIVLVVPVGVTLVGALLAATLGTAMTHDGEARNEGSELVELNR
jgi:hypothetical protein